MSTVTATVRLHTNQREQALLVPLYITGTVAVISVLISLVFWRSGSTPGTDAWIQGSQSNPGIGYALVGFLVYTGVAAVATTFPFALSLGTSRRAFITGTLLWQALTAAYVAVILLALLGLELATGHWFFGFYIFDIHLLGAGDPLQLLAIVFLGVLTSLNVGTVFAAAWVRFGARGPLLIAAGLALALLVAVLVAIPRFAELAAAFELWWLAAAAGGAIVLSSAGSWSLLRRAIVR
ncbi:MAG TPA: hypothetical protein VK065_09265 [Brevibacterium sp.]|nr:hypothetical protein [Brevibacterium sp.]